MRYREGEALNEPKEKGPVVAFGSGHGDRAGSCHYVFRFGSKPSCGGPRDVELWWKKVWRIV